MLELLQYPFMQRALIASVLLAFSTGFLSVFIVQRKMSFLGSGLAHASFGGVALALLLDLNPIAIAALFTLTISLSITWIRNNTKLEVDTAIGVLFSLSMALGILFISMRDSYSADAMTYLFGSVLAIHQTDLIYAAGLIALCLAFYPLWNKWAYASFDRELALSDKIPVGRHDYLLVFLISLAVVLCLKMLGIVLLAAYLVIPGAIARVFAEKFSSMILISILVSLGTSLSGLLSSYYLDIPSGACIILNQASIFILCLLFRKRT